MDIEDDNKAITSYVNQKTVKITPQGYFPNNNMLGYDMFTYNLALTLFYNMVCCCKIILKNNTVTY